MTNESSKDVSIYHKQEELDHAGNQQSEIKVVEEHPTSIVPLPDSANYSPPEFLHLYTALEKNAFDLETQTSIAYNGLAQDGLSQNRPFVLGVTSAVPGEGKTTTATQLALTMALNSYKRICLMDFSLSEETYGDIAQRFALNSSSLETEGSYGAGIVDVLEETALAIPSYQLSEPSNLTVIPRGRTAKRPAKISRSPKIKQMLRSARHAFDIIIIDMPAVSTEIALPLSKHCDGVLMVIHSGATPRELVQRAIDVIGKDNVVGVALNRQKTSIPAWLIRLLRL